jgi:hypothetical protein
MEGPWMSSVRPTPSWRSCATALITVSKAFVGEVRPSASRRSGAPPFDERSVRAANCVTSIP